MNGRRTFLLWFVEVLAVSGGAFFAWTRGVPQAVWANDMSMMTSVIAALFVGTAAWLGWQAWNADEPVWDGRGFQITSAGVSVFEVGDRVEISGIRTHSPSADFGHSAERWSVMLGLLGTTLGLSLQAHALQASGTSSFGALATSLYTTGSGILSALLIGVMVFSLESGIRRARK